MREMVFKYINSASSNKRDLCMEETIEKDGVLATTQRHCLYFVIGKQHIEDTNDIESLANLKIKNLPNRKRHYYVLKTHNSELGEDKILCKVAGTFYAICGNDIYCIAFVHSLKVTFKLTPNHN